MRILQAMIEEKIQNFETGLEFVDNVFDHWCPLEMLTIQNDIGESADFS